MIRDLNLPGTPRATSAFRGTATTYNIFEMPRVSSIFTVTFSGALVSGILHKTHWSVSKNTIKYGTVDAVPVLLSVNFGGLLEPVM